MTTLCGNCGKEFNDSEVEDGICDYCFELVLDKIGERALEEREVSVLLTNVCMER